MINFKSGRGPPGSDMCKEIVFARFAMEAWPTGA